MLRYALFLFFTTILFASCTIIYSTNIPGTPQKSFPQDWPGKYTMITVSPEDGIDSSTLKNVVIEGRRITINDARESHSYSFDDSLRYSVSGQNHYISLLQPNGLYAVAKIIKKDKGFEALAMVLEDSDTPKDQIEKYFDKTEQLKKNGMIDYKVTINPNKLEGFFKSDIIQKETARLAPAK